MLSAKAVADMLERRQLKCKSDKNHNLYYYDNEDVTNFTLPFGVNRNNQFCHFFGSPQKYPFANDEAKRAAQAIVAAEKVRLGLGDRIGIGKVHRVPSVGPRTRCEVQPR